MSWQPSSRQYPDYCRRVHKASIDARARNWYLHSVFVERIMVSGIMFCFSEWRLELRLCPATTLMHSAVEKARFGSSLANGHGDYHSVRSSRLVSVDRSTSMRFEFLASCTLFGRSVAPRSLPTSLFLFDSPPPFDFSFPLFPDALPKPDAKHSIFKVCILCACY